jgi:hypothetical protein
MDRRCPRDIHYEKFQMLQLEETLKEQGIPEIRVHTRQSSVTFILGMPCFEGVNLHKTSA